MSLCVHHIEHCLANAKCYTDTCLTYSKSCVTVFSHDHHQHYHWYMTQQFPHAQSQSAPCDFSSILC